MPSDDVQIDSTVLKNVGDAVKNTGYHNRSESPVSMSSSISSNPGGNMSVGEPTARSMNKTAPAAKATKREFIATSPGEITFFKLLRAELNKAVRFFERAKQELSIREERMMEGIEIMNKPGSSMVSDKWSAMAKAIYRLYKDLLLLELYAIMTYTSFSKILKKHDKNTGYDTRVKFMANVVNKANFTHYPDLLQMICRCEAKYEQVDKVLVNEGKSTSALDEDERLFISMIHRFYGQIMDKAEEEGADVTERKEGLERRQAMISTSPKPKLESTMAYSLKSLVEENDAKKKEGGVSACLSDDPDENNLSGLKRSADSSHNKHDTKKQKN